MERRSKVVFPDPNFVFSSNRVFINLFKADRILFSSSDVATLFVLLVDTAISLPSSFVGASAMLRMERFLRENVVVWSILLPLKTIDTHFSGLRVKSRSEHLSSIVNKRDW